MELEELRTGPDLVKFVRTHAAYPEIFTWFMELFNRFAKVFENEEIVTVATEGVLDVVEKTTGRPLKLRAVEFTYLVSENCHPGYVMAFGQGEQANKIIILDARDPDKPFVRMPPVRKQ